MTALTIMAFLCIGAAGGLAGAAAGLLILTRREQHDA